MSNSFTETTSKSWFARIFQSIIGVLFGILLVIGAIVLLFWNEGRAVQTARSLAEGGKVVIDVAPDAIDPSNDGRLVHFSGDATAKAPLSDPNFGVSTVALRLVRVAEMYQWEEDKHEETHKSLGGSEQTTTTYNYKKVWSDRAINSEHFRQSGDHANPEKAYGGLNATASDARLGAFRLDGPVLALLPADDALRVDTAKSRAPHSQIVDGQIYIGADPASPQIGDYRISYRIAPLGPVSVIGRQAGSGVAPYQTKAGDRLLMAVSGTQAATDMFKDAEENNVILTWVLRLVGLLALWFGGYLLLSPIAVVADVIPFIGSILDAGAGIVSLVFAILGGAVVIAIAWLWYRPLVSLAVIVVGLVVGFALHRLAGRRSAKPAAAAA